MADTVVISECFARDGLQNEQAFIPTDVKVDAIDRIGSCGFKRIEATSYSNPQVVPQFADASELVARIQRIPDAHYKATCANPRSVERANADYDSGHGVNEISVLVSATESHSEKNLRKTRSDQWRNVAEMLALSGQRYRIIGSISVVFGCPFEGRVDPASVLDDCHQFTELGVTHISLGDTTGLATPRSVRALFAAVLEDLPVVTPIAHFHDSRGAALANCVAALDAGCRWFDSSFGGTGGHPANVKYGGGYTGNVATEDLVNLLESMGVATGLDLDRVMETAKFCETVLGRPLLGRTVKSGLSPLIGSEAGRA